MTDCLVLHSPLDLTRPVASGSALRPRLLMEGFKSADINIITIDGLSRRRVKAWKNLSLGESEIIGVYSELSTMPLALTDPDHLPRHPFYEMKLFDRLRKRGIPVSVFYRDIHWRFPQYGTGVGLAKRAVARFFYHLELRQIARSVSHLFLPSLRMLPEIPIDFPAERVSGLPPGAQIRECGRRRDGPLTLFYVGGVLPPLYDLSPMFRAVGRVPNVSLTVCCREWEWQKMRCYYTVPSNVTVVHESGMGLDALYAAADIFLMFWRMTSYMEFAMPVKLFEAIGAGLPVITNARSEMGDFIARESCGWSLENEDALAETLNRLARDPRLARSKRREVEAIRHRHTWTARAHEIIETLQDIRARGLV